jgi:hypothetical protein
MRTAFLLLQAEMLETVTAGIVAFFAAQPSMLDQVPQLGHIPKIFKAMSSRTDCIPKSSLQIVQQLAGSEVRYCRSIHFTVLLPPPVIVFARKKPIAE